VTGVRSMHYGVDFAAQVGTPVMATADGKVVETRYSKTLGKMIAIDHGFGIITRYGHLHERQVSTGQIIERGQIIGSVGRTGLMTTGPHLHYEVHVNGRPVDPTKFIWDNPGPYAYEN